MTRVEKVGDDRAVGKTFGDAVGLDDELARDVGLGDGELDVADGAALVAPLLRRPSSSAMRRTLRLRRAVTP